MRINHEMRLSETNHLDRKTLSILRKYGKLVFDMGNEKIYCIEQLRPTRFIKSEYYCFLFSLCKLNDEEYILQSYGALANYCYNTKAEKDKESYDFVHCINVHDLIYHTKLNASTYKFL